MSGSEMAVGCKITYHIWFCSFRTAGRQFVSMTADVDRTTMVYSEGRPSMYDDDSACLTSDGLNSKDGAQGDVVAIPT